MTIGLSPTVTVREERSAPRQIQGVSTTTPAFVGVTQRGEIGKAKRHLSWADWQKEFGGFVSHSDLPIAVYLAFQNGAREVVTVRTVHYTNIADKNTATAVQASVNALNAGAGSAKAVVYGRTKAPFTLENGQTLQLKLNGVSQPLFTVSATRAVLTSVNAETQNMSGGKTLVLAIDNGSDQTITFVDADFATPSAATAEEVAAVINAQIVGARAYDSGGDVVIESDTLGSNSEVHVKSGTADTVWDWGTTAAVGTGNVENVDEVSIAELKTGIEAVVTGVTVSEDEYGYMKIEHNDAGSTKTLQVEASSTADTPLKLDNDVHAGLDSAGTAGSVTSTETEPWLLANGDTLQVSIDGAGAVTATFDATRASVESGNAETYNMSGGKDLTFRLNGVKEFTVQWVNGDFATPTAATAEEIVEAANKQVKGCRFLLSTSKTKVTLESDRAGTGSRLEILSGTAVSIFDFPSAAVGTGDAEDIAAITFAEVKAVLEDAIAGLRCTKSDTNQLVLNRADAGSAKSIQVTGGTAQTKFGLSGTSAPGTTGSPATVGQFKGKTEGIYAHDYVARISDATSGQADEFNLTILKNSVIIEFYANLTMGAYSGTVPTDPNYIVDVLDADTGSNIMTFVDALVTGTATDRRIANGDYTPAGGDDGLTGLVDADFLGDETGENGLRALDEISDVSLLAVPGRASSTLHNGMLNYAEVTRKRRIFCVLDLPSGYTWDQARTYVTSTAALKGASEYGSCYWPELKISNPDTSVFGKAKEITCSNSGAVIGRYIFTDLHREGGVHMAPAGEDGLGVLQGVVGLADESVNREVVRDKIYPDNINPIWKPQGGRIHLGGVAILDRTGDFPSIPERRGMIFINSSVEDGLDFVKFKNNTPELRENVDRTVTNFLTAQTRLGAFESTDPSQAFTVDVGDALNPLEERRAGRLNLRYTVAKATPVEYVSALVSKDTRDAAVS